MFSQNNNGFSDDLLKAVREATAKGPAPRNPREVEEAHKKAGTVPKTPREKELARKHGHPGLITKGDVVKARMASEEAEPVEEGVEDKLAAARAMHQMNNPGKPTGAKKAVAPLAGRKVPGTRYGGSNQKNDQPDDMKEELFTDAELEAISTAAAKL